MLLNAGHAMSMFSSEITPEQPPGPLTQQAAKHSQPSPKCHHGY